MNQNNYTFIDLFAGTSALSEGFIEKGFVPLAHVEMDKNACLTISTRAVYHFLKKSGNLADYYRYLRKEISREELYSMVPKEILQSVINAEISDKTTDDIFNRIEESDIFSKFGKHVDFIVGGPPCQAYSMVVRHKNGIAEDNRCFLYRQYGKFLKRYQPKGFVFENVLGIRTAGGGRHYQNLCGLFQNLGYELYPMVMESNKYGVLQKRKRLIIFGWKKGYKFNAVPPQEIVHNWTTKDIFSDLDDINAGESSSKYKSGPTDYLRHFQLRNTNDVLTWHVARPLNDLDREKYIYAVGQLLNHKRRISYLEFDEHLQTMKKSRVFTDRFKVVNPDDLSQTVVAHISRDGHYYIYPSLKYVRSISVREAARLQSFPDSFFFEGSRGAAFRQIGNAVPPLMSRAITDKVLETIENNEY